MPDPTVCPYCGAYSSRYCEWEEVTGNMAESAPCNFDEWDADPDFMRDDRAERERLEWEGGE